MNHSMAVADAAPYPPVQVCGPNVCLAQKISKALGCPNSELSAITRYAYQHWILADGEPDLAETVFRIAKVEMHHLDMLGKLVTELGGDPRYACHQRDGCINWNSGMLHYSRDLRAILLHNIADEKKTTEFYRETAREATDPLVAAVLNRIALDEILHVEIFEQYLRELCGVG